MKKGMSNDQSLLPEILFYLVHYTSILFILRFSVLRSMSASCRQLEINSVDLHSTLKMV